MGGPPTVVEGLLSFVSFGVPSLAASKAREEELEASGPWRMTTYAPMTCYSLRFSDGFNIF